MVKGGFQGLDISGVDLTAQSPTLPGAYATCAGADGKPIRVQTAYGQVECSVKKVSTNYVLAGITGDGKILSITIGSTDGISVSESVIPSGTEPDEYLDGGIDISGYTATNYITEYDGLVKIANLTGNELTNSYSVNIRTGASSTGGLGFLNLMIGSPNGSAAICFVKKGTVLYCSAAIEGVTAKFLPYKPVES